MAHRLGTPERLERKTIWFASDADGDPVVKVQTSGAASCAPSVPRSPGSSVTVKVVFAGSGPEGTNCRMRRAVSVMPAAPSGATRLTEPATPGSTLMSRSRTLCGSIGRSSTTAIAVVTAIPCAVSWGRSARACRPAETVEKLNRNGSESAVPARSVAVVSTTTRYWWSGSSGWRGMTVTVSPDQRRSTSTWGMTWSASPHRRGVHQCRERHRDRGVERARPSTPQSGRWRRRWGSRPSGRCMARWRP